MKGLEKYNLNEKDYDPFGISIIKLQLILNEFPASVGVTLSGFDLAL